MAVDVKVALDAAGNATAAWVQEGDTEVSVEASTHPVGGTWSAPVDIAVPGDIFNSVSVAAASGVSVAVWNQTVGGHNVIHAATGPPGRLVGAGPAQRGRPRRPRPRVGLDAAAEASSAGSTVSRHAVLRHQVSCRCVVVAGRPPASSTPGNMADDLRPGRR